MQRKKTRRDSRLAKAVGRNHWTSLSPVKCRGAQSKRDSDRKERELRVRKIKSPFTWDRYGKLLSLRQVAQKRGASFLYIRDLPCAILSQSGIRSRANPITLAQGGRPQCGERLWPSGMFPHPNDSATCCYRETGRHYSIVLSLLRSPNSNLTWSEDEPLSICLFSCDSFSVKRQLILALGLGSALPR